MSDQEKTADELYALCQERADQHITHGGDRVLTDRFLALDARCKAGDLPEAWKSWNALTSIVDTVYPEDVFPTKPDDPDRDPGPRIVSLCRRISALEAEVERLRDGIKAAWAVIQNAHHGNFNEATEEWYEDAQHWRDTHWKPSLKRSTLEAEAERLRAAEKRFHFLASAMNDYRWLAGEMLAFLTVNMREGQPLHDRMEPMHRAEIKRRIEEWQQFKDRADRRET